MWASLIAVVSCGYLLGSIPFGQLLARARGVDIQSVGSGNIGATNVARTLGKKLGALVLVLDALKGAVPLLVASWLVLPPPSREVAGFAAIVGHCFPVWLRFRGGKGVATALGVFMALDPAATGVVFVLFALVYAWRRIASLGSMAASALFPIVQLGLGRPPPEIALGAGVAVLIVLRHRDNLERLREGSEPTT